MNQDNFSIQLKDYRDIKNKYEKVVSIEMFEAVGKKYWDIYFKKLNSILKTNGEALIFLYKKGSLKVEIAKFMRFIQKSLDKILKKIVLFIKY